MLNSKSIGRVLLTGACVMSLCLSTTPVAFGQAAYLKQFKADYGKKYEGKDVKLSCAVCHPTKSKKERNNFGAALAKELGAKKVKDAKKISEALAKVCKKESATEGKTFGELIEAGELPGTKEVAK